MAKRTVLIAEDDFIIREGLLRHLLEPAFTVIAVDNGRDVATAATANEPEIALLDISMPGQNGFEAATELLQTNPSCRVLFVSSHSERAYIEKARSLGASGYVVKSRVQNELLLAIHSALAGEFYE